MHLPQFAHFNYIISIFGEGNGMEYTPFPVLNVPSILASAPSNKSCLKQNVAHSVALLFIGVYDTHFSSAQ